MTKYSGFVIVASALTMTGSDFMSRFRLFLAQYTCRTKWINLYVNKPSWLTDSYKIKLVPQGVQNPSEMCDSVSSALRIRFQSSLTNMLTICYCILYKLYCVQCIQCIHVQLYHNRGQIYYISFFYFFWLQGISTFMISALTLAQ